MTTTIAILCPEGIVMGADMRITILNEKNEITDFDDGVQKIYEIKKTPVGLAYWGLASFRQKTVLEHLETFEDKYVKEGDNVDTVSKKLTAYLQDAGSIIGTNIGFYVSGYQDDVPRLKHVFHMNCKPRGVFIDEDAHIQYHQFNGNTVTYSVPQKFPVLFNGDNLVANVLFNIIKEIEPRYDIIPDLLTLEESIDLAKLILDVSIERLNFYWNQDARKKKIPATVGGGINIVTITASKGLEWIK